MSFVVRLPPSGSAKKLLITPHLRPTSPCCPKCPICPPENKTPPRFPLRAGCKAPVSWAALANACRQWQTSEAQLSHRSRKGGAKHPFLGRLNCADACLPPTHHPHWLGHSNGAAGASLGLIGLMGLIGQRLTEWQALFQNVFCGAAPALRFNG